MRRVGLLCCAVSLLMFVGVGQAAPIGPHHSSSTAGAPAILLGARTLQHSVVRVSAGRAEAFPFSVRRAGTVSEISVYVDAHNTAKTLAVALYSSRSGHRVSRVASGTLSSPKAGSWNAVSVTRASVRSRRPYWVALLGRGGTLYVRDARKACQRQAYPKSRLASLPRPSTRGTRLTACSISAYATRQATSGTSGAPLTFGTFAPADPALPSTSTPATTISGAPAAPAAPNSAPPALPLPTFPPVNVGAPTVTGSPVSGSTLTTSTGSWIDGPTSYAYQWQDCNGLGLSCASISGATSSSYTLQAGDVGSTVRSVVTATNSGGSGSASSAATGVVASGGGGGSSLVGAPTPAGVSCSQTLNAGASVQGAVSGASPGSVVCLNAGSWSAITLSSIAPSSPVTVAATPGQTVSVPGFTITGTSKNLTIEGFTITSGAGNGHGNGIDLLCQINGGVTLTHNTIENISGGDAIHGYAGSCGGSETQNGVSITYNQLDHASTFVEVQGNSCACASADTNWTISHNVMGPDQNYGGGGHYIQGQWIGATIDNNAFEGPTVFNSNAHNNVLHCYSTNAPGCQNITFENNIIWHAQSRAQTILISDNNLTGIHIDNNLDIDDPACGQSLDCPASPWFVEKGYNYTLMHNTSVGAVWSINLGTCGDGCVSNPNTWDAEYNIAVGTPQSGQNNYGSWACQTSCTTGHNTSQDNSANSNWGGTGNDVNWTPTWQNTNWTPVNGPGYQPPPTGYYQPTGLSITGAGYQGQIGP